MLTLNIPSCCCWRFPIDIIACTYKAVIAELVSERLRVLVYVMYMYIHDIVYVRKAKQSMLCFLVQFHNNIIIALYSNSGLCLHSRLRDDVTPSLLHHDPHLNNHNVIIMYRRNISNTIDILMSTLSGAFPDVRPQTISFISFGSTTKSVSHQKYHQNN